MASIKDVVVDETIILILTGDCLLIHDTISLTRLRAHSIPGRIRRVAGPDFDSDGRFAAQILSFDSKGRILIKWGMRNIHIWNVGNRIAGLDNPHRSLENRASHTARPTRASISQDIKEDFGAYVDAKMEREERAQFFGEYTVAGLNESEMLQYAQMLSLEQESHALLNGTIQSNSNSNEGAARISNQPFVVDSQDEDYDLRLAIQLSLSEQQKY